MSTSNFHNVNASKIFAVEINNDWDMDDLECNLSNELDLYHQAGVQDPDELRSYPSKILGYLEEYECCRVKWDDIELTMRIFPVIRSGYYKDVNLDWFIEVRDVFDVEITRPECLLQGGLTDDEKTEALNEINSWIETSQSKLISQIENVFEKYSTPLNCVGIASNGEAFYQRVKE